MKSTVHWTSVLITVRGHEWDIYIFISFIGTLFDGLAHGTILNWSNHKDGSGISILFNGMIHHTGL